MFPVTRAELFLILGRGALNIWHLVQRTNSSADGADLLALSKEFNVHIALAPDPLALRIEGVINSLRAITERITLLKLVRRFANILKRHHFIFVAEYGVQSCYITQGHPYTYRRDATNIS